MNIHGRLSEFLEILDRAPSLEELCADTLNVIRHFQLSALASGIIAGSKAATPERFHFAHWPPGLLERYLAEDLQAVDPIPRWGRGTGTPATFSHIFQRLRPKDPAHRMIQLAREYGCIEGICVPMRAADGALGIVSMTGDRAEFSPEEFRDLVAIGSLVFRRAEIINHSADLAQGAPILTLREIELLPFLIHGHSDREIAVLNSISEATVRFHLKNVRIKVGAVSRTHLAAKVVQLGFASL